MIAFVGYQSARSLPSVVTTFGLDSVLDNHKCLAAIARSAQDAIRARTDQGRATTHFIHAMLLRLERVS